MPTVREMTPLSDLGRDGEGVARRPRESDQPLVIAQDGKATAALLRIGHFERMEHERGLLLSLLGGGRDIAAGRTVDLETVLAEADALLA